MDTMARFSPRQFVKNSSAVLAFGTEEYHLVLESSRRSVRGMIAHFHCPCMTFVSPGRMTD
jgi:hypothetical protein